MSDVILEAWLYCKTCRKWTWFTKFGHKWFCSECDKG